MKSFKENLAAFQVSKNVSRSEIILLSELTVPELVYLENEEDIRSKTLFRFCVNCGIDFRSIYSDSGFKSVTLVDQYATYPDVIKKSVSFEFIKKLISICGSPDRLRKRLLFTIKSERLVTRLINGTSLIDGHLIPLIRQSVSDLISAIDFDLAIANLMYSRIANYNFRVLKKHFNLDYPTVANFLGLTTTWCASWGDKHMRRIPDDAARTLGNCLGVPDMREFLTIPLDPKSLAGRKCSISLGSKLPDPVSDSQPVKSEPEESYTSIVTDEIKPSNESGCQGTEFGEFKITDDMIIKMFKSLNPDDKSEISKLIATKFFDNM